jgi:hypothetical protein
MREMYSSSMYQMWTVSHRIRWTPILTFGLRRLRLLEWYESASGVVLSIAEARHRFSSGEADEVTVEDDELAPATEVDREMANYFDAVWDD